MVGLSPTSSIEVKNEWSYTSAPPICLYVMDGDSCAFHIQECKPQGQIWKVVESSNLSSDGTKIQ